MRKQNLDLTLRRARGAETTILPDGFVAIIAQGSPAGFTLSPAGAVFWELSDGSLTVGETIEQVFEFIVSVQSEAGYASDTKPEEMFSKQELSEELTGLVDQLIANRFAEIA